MSFVQIYFLIYGALSLVHIAMQMLFGHLEHRRQRRIARPDAAESSLPSVTVVVPSYNEDPALLHQCLLSIDRQEYPDIEAILVDDGSANLTDVIPVHDEFSAGRFRIVRQPDNRGKRSAQSVVFDEARGDIVVTIDSDTVLAPDAIRTIVRRFSDPRVGAVTGNVEVINNRHNLLTRLIAYRYWMAFNQERAAQSLFGVVMCASGPFSAYRRSIIDAVKDRYITQRFLGQVCTFGDDRHLTNLVLEAGHRVVYDEAAVARTHVPETIPFYLRQQVRWNKSFYREILWTLRFAHRRNGYLILDLALQIVLPFMLLVALGAAAYAATSAPQTLWRYVAVIVGIGFARSLYGLLRTRSPGFLLFTSYGFIHVFLLIPTRLYALATMRRGQWGSRGSDRDDAAEKARQRTLFARSEQGMTDARETWERDIRTTVERGDAFVLDAQPMRNLWSGRNDQHELLLRLRHGDQILPPAEFLSIAASHGLLAQVDLWVVREAIDLLARRRSLVSPSRLAVNVSLQSIREPAYVGMVGRLLGESGAPARNLVFEVSESDAVADPAAVREFGRRVRSLGCMLALDNFGAAQVGAPRAPRPALRTGLPLDYVKLDGSLVRALPANEVAQVTLRVLVAQAKRMGVDVAAVFVGDEETVRILEREGVDYGQGFHIGGTVPAAWLAPPKGPDDAADDGGSAEPLASVEVTPTADVATPPAATIAALVVDDGSGCAKPDGVEASLRRWSLSLASTTEMSRTTVLRWCEGHRP